MGVSCISHSIFLCFQADEQRRALDENGLRYLISLKSFLMVNQRNSDSAGERQFAEISTRERMRYRDFVWAFHSSCQEILLQAALSSVGGKMVWKDAKALGVFLWLKSQESMVSVHRCTRFPFSTAPSGLKWKILLAINIWPAKIETLPHAPCCILHWVNTNSYRVSGSGQLGIVNRSSCSSSFLMTLPSLDGRPRLSRMLMHCLESNVRSMRLPSSCSADL